MRKKVSFFFYEKIFWIANVAAFFMAWALQILTDYDLFPHVFDQEWLNSSFIFIISAVVCNAIFSMLLVIFFFRIWEMTRLYRRYKFVGFASADNRHLFGEMDESQYQRLVESCDQLTPWKDAIANDSRRVGFHMHFRWLKASLSYYQETATAILNAELEEIKVRGFGVYEMTFKCEVRPKRGLRRKHPTPDPIMRQSGHMNLIYDSRENKIKYFIYRTVSSDKLFDGIIATLPKHHTRANMHWPKLRDNKTTDHNNTIV